MDKHIIVDKQDEHLLVDYHWRIYSRGYAVTSINGSTVFLHHLIGGFPALGFETDHINQNKLDNRRSNLRHVTHRVNLLNRTFRNKSGYAGVYFEKGRTKPYKAVLRRFSKTINLGYYATPEEANKVVVEYKHKNDR